MSAQPQFGSFTAFFPFYLSEHSDVRNRVLHYIGTTLVIVICVSSVVLGSFLGLLAMPVAGYGFAWFGHFVIEGNRPATFKYPLWSLRGDFKMYGLFLTGRLAAPLAAAIERWGAQPDASGTT